MAGVNRIREPWEYTSAFDKVLCTKILRWRLKVHVQHQSITSWVMSHW